MTLFLMDSSLANQEGFRFLGQRHIRLNMIKKDKMRHAMDDNGIPSKEIHERHRERAITAEEEPDDTKPLQYVPKSQTDQ
ncbi:hypothetical protein Tco_0092694 [Tanacetum coccineum]